MDAVLFDLGGVLIDWNPRYLYRPLFKGDERAMEWFLETVCPPQWNHEMDAGRPFAEAIAERQQLFPDYAELIAKWGAGWETMLKDVIPESIDIVAELRDRGMRLCALTNWSAETFPVARTRFPFLTWFEDIVVSGEVKLAKPDPRIFRLAIERCQLKPQSTVYVDDSHTNVLAGRQAGLHSLHFHTPSQLRADLHGLGLL
jgi:2-haloacid dehalogenase